jgi:diguanylate cyclase (GGDEF)-like protein
VSIPLAKIESIAVEQTNLITLFIILIFGCGLLVIAYFVIRDLVRTQQSAEEMSWRANHDDLTGLSSRLAFEHRAEELLGRCREDNSTHALLYMDLDQFKIVNDTCGHIAGDELLCEIATTMGKSIRNSDMLARLGGDEFGVLLEGCDIEHAYDRAEKLRVAIRDLRFTRGNRNFEIGVSIGLVAINNNSDDITSVLSLADLACYTAKDEGRNRIKVYSDSDTQIDIRHEEMEWASKFNRAIDENRLKLAVQHSKCLNKEIPDSLYSEVLLRMVDSDGRPVPTSVFISAAERYHFMPTIDRWVVKTVMSMIKHRHLPLAPGQIIAINLSGLSINEADFLDYVRDLFVRYPEVPPRQICFEITETAAVGNIASAQRFIRKLRKLGCLFALDDFGSGLSSFAYLKNLHIDFLKIEGSFVRDMLDDSMDMVVVEAVSLIGKRVNVRTIAEWVENDTILRAVRALEIDYAQGFGIHKPEIIEVIEDEIDLSAALQPQGG